MDVKGKYALINPLNWLMNSLLPFSPVYFFSTFDCLCYYGRFSCEMGVKFKKNQL